MKKLSKLFKKAKNVVSGVDEVQERLRNAHDRIDGAINRTQETLKERISLREKSLMALKSRALEVGTFELVEVSQEEFKALVDESTTANFNEAKGHEIATFFRGPLITAVRVNETYYRATYKTEI